MIETVFVIYLNYVKSNITHYIYLIYRKKQVKYSTEQNTD